MISTDLQAVLNRSLIIGFKHRIDLIETVAAVGTLYDNKTVSGILNSCPVDRALTPGNINSI